MDILDQHIKIALQKNGSEAGFEQDFTLDLEHCRLSMAAPQSTDYSGPQSLQDSHIATSFVAALGYRPDALEHQDDCRQHCP